MSEFGVFIIESIRRGEYPDGDNLNKILKLSDIKSAYSWADTKEDFIDSLNNFEDSNLRYLYLSCHADAKGIEINGEVISNSEIGRLTEQILKDKRVFLSVCKGGNRELASLLIKNGAYSVVGTPIDLEFAKAGLFWPSFFHVVNENCEGKLNRKVISETIKRCVDLFTIPINFYSRIENETNMLWRLKIRPNERTDNRQIKI